MHALRWTVAGGVDNFGKSRFEDIKRSYIPSIDILIVTHNVLTNLEAKQIQIELNWGG